MTPLQIVGHPGCGKTTIIVEIVEELVRQNLRVGTIKHSAHAHELDKPGKDTFLHRNAGAVPVSMVTKSMTAIYFPENHDMTTEDMLGKYYSESDIVLIEGWISGPYGKIEVWRNESGRVPLFYEIDNVVGFVTDDKHNPEYLESAEDRNIRIFSRSDLTKLLEFIKSRTLS